MCDPTSIAVASLALGVAGTAATAVVQQQAARKQDKSLVDNANAQNAAEAERMKQVNASFADQMSARARAAMIERGRLAAAASESGLGDNGRIVQESYFNESTDIAHLQANNAANLKQTGYEAQGLTARTQSDLNRVQRPSWITTGLQIAGAGVDYENKVQGPGQPEAPFDASKFSSNSEGFDMGTTQPSKYSEGH